jgi:hypothetical protein
MLFDPIVMNTIFANSRIAKFRIAESPTRINAFVPRPMVFQLGRLAGLGKQSGRIITE